MLPQELLAQIVTAAVEAGLDRHALLAGLDRSLSAQLPEGASPKEQIWDDLQELNRVGALPDGKVPLRDWLQAALQLASPRPEAQTFRHALDVLSRTAPEITEPSSFFGHLFGTGGQPHRISCTVAVAFGTAVLAPMLLYVVTAHRSGTFDEDEPRALDAGGEMRRGARCREPIDPRRRWRLRPASTDVPGATSICIRHAREPAAGNLCAPVAGEGSARGSIVWTARRGRAPLAEVTATSADLVRGGEGLAIEVLGAGGAVLASSPAAIVSGVDLPATSLCLGLKIAVSGGTVSFYLDD